MFHKISALLITVFFSVISYAQNPLVIEDGVDQVNVKDYAYHFEDVTDEYTFPEITKVNWIKLQGGIVFPFNKYPQWIKYEFENNSDEMLQKVLFIPYHIIHEIDAYSTVDSELYESYSTGTRRDYREKDFHSSGYPIKLNFKPKKVTTVYLKLKYLYRPLRGTTYLMSEKRVGEVLVNTERIIWGWRGILFFALLSSFILFWFLKSKMFLYYFFLNLGVAFFIASQIGDYFYLVNVDSNDFTTLIDYFGALLVCLFVPLFLSVLTPKIKERNKLGWKIITYLVYGVGLFVFLSMFPLLRMSELMYYAHFYIMIVAGIVFISQPIMLFRCVLKKDENALISFFIYALYAFAAFASAILPNMGVMDDSPYVHNALLFGSSIEIISFMFLIGRETLNIFKERSMLVLKQRNHQKEISFSMVKGQEEERNRVGRELHDLVGANMAIIKKEINVKEGELYHVVERTIEAVRNLSQGLVTPKVDGNQFVDEIKEMCHLISSNTLEIDVIFHKWPTIYSADVATHLYRITQELLHNASKHSKAQNVYLQFVLDNEKVFRLIYEDNGVGFDIHKVKKGLGLQNIKNRVGLIGGILIIDSGKNGTIVIVEFK